MKLTYKDKSTVAELEISPATVKGEIIRERTQGRVWRKYFTDGKGNKLPEDQWPKQDNDEYYEEMNIFPAMVCCTTGFIKVHGKEIDFHDHDKFTNIPGKLFRKWRDMATEVNGYLFGIEDEPEPAEAEKKMLS